MDAQTKKEFQKLGKKINDLSQATKQGFDIVDKRFEQVDKRFDKLEKKIDTEIEKLAVMTKREFDNVYEKMDDLATKEQIDEVLDKIDNLQEKQTATDSQFKQFKTNYLIQDK